MAARNFTGSARVRAAGSKSGARKISANLADAAARMGDIRAGITASVESLRGQNVRVDADVAAALKRRAYDPLSSLLEYFGKLVASACVVCPRGLGPANNRFHDCHAATVI